MAVDELLDGQWLSARTCPHCDHPPEDFIDEETIVEWVEGNEMSPMIGISLRAKLGLRWQSQKGNLIARSLRH